MTDGNREVHEFMGMWPFQPDADLVELTNSLPHRVSFMIMLKLN